MKQAGSLASSMKTVHNDSHADSSSGTHHPESAHGRGVRASAFSQKNPRLAAELMITLKQSRA